MGSLLRLLQFRSACALYPTPVRFKGSRGLISGLKRDKKTATRLGVVFRAAGPTSHSPLSRGRRSEQIRRAGRPSRAVGAARTQTFPLRVSTPAARDCKRQVKADQETSTVFAGIFSKLLAELPKRQLAPGSRAFPKYFSWYRLPLRLNPKTHPIRQSSAFPRPQLSHRDIHEGGTLLASAAVFGRRRSRPALHSPPNS